ncbi:MAG: hypothetical protein KF833_04090 [Verrucomicrobiae bacterium]|nr:hypothetical protein [Verrucomicrobiae bacterium]
MRWHHLLLDNFWWKLLAFALAVMIWSGSHSSEVRNPAATPVPDVTKTLANVPIRILALPGIAGPAHLQPATAQIEISGPPHLVRRLHPNSPDVLVFVELTADFFLGPVTNTLEVRLASGLRWLQLQPEHVVLSPFSAE